MCTPVGFGQQGCKWGAKNEVYPLARREALTAGLWPAGEGANIDRRLVPYTRDAMRTKSRIEFICLYVYIFIYLYICINRGPHARAYRNFGPGK